MTESPTQLRATGRLLVALGVVAALAVTGVVSAPSGGAAERFDAGIDATIADIQSYWATTMPAVYRADYEPIPADRLIPYSASNPPPACGGYGTTPYDEVVGNAFYCSEGDFVVWDEQELPPKLRAQFGAFASALVLADEWGHAIQARVGYETYQTVYMEQQADCFAGVWTARRRRTATPTCTSPTTTSTPRSPACSSCATRRASMVASRARTATASTVCARSRTASKTARPACADYENNPPRVTESAYTSQADYMSGGDMSLGEVLPAVQDSLSTYWGTTPKVVAYEGPDVPSCDGDTDGGVLTDEVTYCPSTNTIVDRPRHACSGRTIRSATSLPACSSPPSGPPPCSTRRASRSGAPTRAAAPTVSPARTWSSLDANDSRNSSSNDITLSPGDLDEVVSTLVAANGPDGDRATAFKRVPRSERATSEGPAPVRSPVGVTTDR